MQGAPSPEQCLPHSGSLFPIWRLQVLAEMPCQGPYYLLTVDSPHLHTSMKPPSTWRVNPPHQCSRFPFPSCRTFSPFLAFPMEWPRTVSCRYILGVTAWEGSQQSADPVAGDQGSAESMGLGKGHRTQPWWRAGAWSEPAGHLLSPSSVGRGSGVQKHLEKGPGWD